MKEHRFLVGGKRKAFEKLDVRGVMITIEEMTELRLMVINIAPS